MLWRPLMQTSGRFPWRGDRKKHRPQRDIFKHYKKAVVTVINAAISHLANQLNQFLKRSFGLTEDIVTVSNIVEPDGSIAPNVNNKLVMLLTNIERDTVPFRKPSSNASGNARSPISVPPLYLNLYVMVAANFSGKNYPEALKLISNTISFFQRQPVFDRNSTPDLDQRIEKLILDMENLKIQDLSNVWGLLGGKYLPSVLYKVRMVTFDAADIVGQVPTLQDPQLSLNH